MRNIILFPMLLFTFFIFILAPNLTKAAVLSDAAEIPYQINNSDHIVIGTVSGINVYYNHTIATITVNEWLYNPLPDKIIKVRTEIGTNVNTEDQPVFTKNESALLMLLDQDRLFIDEDIDKQKDIDKQQFIVSVGFVGKHPISDRDAVINVLKAQGKWNGENLTGNKTNETETINKTEITRKQTENTTENVTVADRKAENKVSLENQKEESNTTQRSYSTPFICPIWIIVIMLSVVLYIRKMK
jgi:hypothetical protein